VRQRNRSGSVVLDKRIKTWNFFFWEMGKRRSRKIGTMNQFPTKASAWRAAKPLRDAIENQISINNHNANRDQASRTIPSREDAQASDDATRL
jgi:hypothetical protein